MDIYKSNFTTLELELFSFLCMRSGEKLSQRESALALKVSPTAVANSVSSLLKKGLITCEKTKTINFISLNRDNPKAVSLKRVENLRLLYGSGLSDFLEEQLAGSSIILFGSYSKGEDARLSDIDIAVIGRDKKALDLLKYEKGLNRKININFYKSWKDIQKNLKNNILNGIVLSGSVDL